MGLFDSFKRNINKDKDILKKHFRNLIIMAMMDGRLDIREIDLITVLAEMWGLSHNDLDSIIRELSKYPIESLTESIACEHYDRLTEDEKIRQLFDLVLLMMIDGDIDDREYDFCTLVAIRMGFPPSIVRHIIDEIIYAIEKFNDQYEAESYVKKQIREKLHYIF